MKLSIPILILFVFTQLAMAQPGGKPHKVTAYDYQDYTNSNILQKTFDRYEGDPDNPLKEVWSFDTSITGQLVVTEVTSIKDTEDPIEYTRCMINKYLSTVSALLWAENNSCDPYQEPPDELTVRINDSLVPILTSTMTPGIAWGSGTLMQIYDENGSRLQDQYFIDKNEVLGIEDVSVPAGNYADCLKIHRHRQVSYTPHNRMEWYCPNMGLVKRVQAGSRIMVLTDVIYSE